MAVELSVNDVRIELVRAASGAGASPGEGEPATLLLGTLFHQVFADLVSRDARRSGIRVLFEAGADRGTACQDLIRHTYDALVGPRLTRHQAQLNETTQGVLTFWRAIQNLGTWLTDLVLDLRSRTSAQDGTSGWQSVAAHFAAEQELACELRAPGWSDAVRLTGIVDSLVRAPVGERICAIELKLGRGRPAVDLGQAALYRLIAARCFGVEGALALLRFSAELEETVVTATQLADAEARLVDLIGTMAGVVQPMPQATGGSAVVPLPQANGGSAVVPPPHANGGSSGLSPPRPPDTELAQRIVRAYREYGRPIELPAPPIVGPRFLRFEVRLGKGVSVAQVTKLTPEIGIRAGLRGEPMVRRIAGRLCIDVERPDPQTVPFSVVREGLGKPDPRFGSARLAIGVDPSGALVCADLSAPITAHVLVAGSAGSGKSEWLRMAVGGLMVVNTRDTLRIALIDPKMSAFMDLRSSPWLHNGNAFWVPGEGVEITDFLDDLIGEMERRYKTLQAARADDLAAYLAGGTGRMPRIVCFCDEYFALISGDRRERKNVEERIALLAAKGRAAGVHMVIATQQASREVIKGTLDANLSCRVGLRMSKAIESRLLLETTGAELLSGYGDLLYKAIGDPMRLQAPYLPPDERASLFAASTRTGRSS